MRKVSGLMVIALMAGFACLLMGADNTVRQPGQFQVDDKTKVVDKTPAKKVTTPATQIEGLQVNKALLKPDLLPVNPGNVVNNCTNPPDNGWKLIITVKNQGKKVSSVCTTSVTFWVTVPNTTTSEPKTFEIPTPAIQPGQSVEIGPANIPTGCYRPDCMFKIIVDSKNQVDELGEDNNIMTGFCIG
jgi:hypothetical protein